MPADDNRIQGLFKQYSKKEDGKLFREEFLQFYFEAARDRADRVHDNLKNHFIRVDLVKLSEIVDPASFEKKDMPRFTLSSNQE